MNKETLSLALAMIILGMTPKAQLTKDKTNKLDYSNLNIFHKAKETINTVKRQYTKWEKIFSNHILDKGLMSKLYKEFDLIARNNPI